MTDKTEVQFNIDVGDVDRHAPIVYKAIQEHYTRMDRLINILSKTPDVKQKLHSDMIFFGILPNKEIKYDEVFLCNDSFKISVIYHLCFSNILCRMLSWEAYLHLQGVFSKAFMNTSDENLSVDTIMLKFFKVNPKVIPISYLNHTMKMDEFNYAVEFIDKKLKDLKQYDPEEFDDYDEYFDYVKLIADKIIGDCHANQFYNTHEIERFTCACIASKNGLPILDMLYDISELSSHRIVEINSIKRLQEKIFKKEFGEEDDDDDDDDE